MLYKKIKYYNEIKFIRFTNSSKNSRCSLCLYGRCMTDISYRFSCYHVNIKIPSTIKISYVPAKP